jgi:hypothetical protein
MKRLVLVLALLACAAGHGGALAADGANLAPFSVTIEPKELHEECVELKAGEKRRYYWKSDAAVDFNIHYHAGSEVFYPVKRSAMRGDGGTFTAGKGTQHYCWMWTARDKAAKVEGRIEK